MVLCESDAWFYLSWIFFVFATSFLLNSGSSTSSNFYKELVRPPLSPPPILFPIAWTILYLLMAFSAALVQLQGGWSANPITLGLFMGHMVINALWTAIFFRFKLIGFSVFWILLVLGTSIPVFILFIRISRLAGYLLIPYLVWLTFATYLNIGIYALNKNRVVLMTKQISTTISTSGRIIRKPASNTEDLEWN